MPRTGSVLQEAGCFFSVVAARTSLSRGLLEKPDFRHALPPVSWLCVALLQVAWSGRGKRRSRPWRYRNRATGLSGRPGHLLRRHHQQHRARAGAVKIPTSSASRVRSATDCTRDLVVIAVRCSFYRAFVDAKIASDRLVELAPNDVKVLSPSASTPRPCLGLRRPDSGRSTHSVQVGVAHTPRRRSLHESSAHGDAPRLCF
jgi:hypothetical protein